MIAAPTGNWQSANSAAPMRHMAYNRCVGIENPGGGWYPPPARTERLGLPVRIDPTLLARFWSKVKKSEDPQGYWLWTASITEHGYEQFWLAGKMRHAHRVAWVFVHGPIPKGGGDSPLHVLHNCPGGDNPACVNPAHLFIGTQHDNVRDMFAKGRANKRRGEMHPKAKMTELQAREALRRYRAGESPSRLAREYGVTKQAICQLGKGKNWSMLQ